MSTSSWYDPLQLAVKQARQGTLHSALIFFSSSLKTYSLCYWQVQEKPKICNPLENINEWVEMKVKNIYIYKWEHIIKFTFNQESISTQPPFCFSRKMQAPSSQFGRWKTENSMECFNHHTSHQQWYYTKINSKLQKAYQKVRNSKVKLLYFICIIFKVYIGYSHNCISCPHQQTQNSIQVRIRLNKSLVQFLECFKPLSLYSYLRQWKLKF